MDVDVVLVERRAVDAGALGEVGDGYLTQVALGDQFAQGGFEGGAGAEDPAVGEAVAFRGLR
jgi:hypothetical protein